jgi:hypothetical protein
VLLLKRNSATSRSMVEPSSDYEDDSGTTAETMTGFFSTYQPPTTAFFRV